MNVEYMCKAKRKDNNEWVTGYYVFTRKSLDVFDRMTSEFNLGKSFDIFDQMISKFNFDRYLIIDLRGKLHEVIPETVAHCTGLKDKNGKLIFTGDIVESRASENQADWKRWVVGFSDGSFCFNRKNPKKRKHKYEENLLCVDEIELYGLTVIGNIHDNPELLEVEE